jgi:hypothetical protein
MKSIGIVCERPTDYIILREIVDKITGEDNYYVQLQPEEDLVGKYGNGWKGVWKWCVDNAAIKDKLMKDIEPVLDLLIIQVDGDVARKEKVVHCGCEATVCKYKGIYNPIECDVKKEIREMCPIVLPCTEHEESVNGYIEHLEHLVRKWLGNLKDTCVVVPCDSTEAWVVAAYDELENAEEINNPWINIISKKKSYHNIRISGNQKRMRVFEELVKVVCSNWEKVTEICVSAKKFEDDISYLIKK